VTKRSQSGEIGSGDLIDARDLDANGFIICPPHVAILEAIDDRGED
jgi:hypothetical protein